MSTETNTTPCGRCSHAACWHIAMRGGCTHCACTRMEVDAGPPCAMPGCTNDPGPDLSGICPDHRGMVQRLADLDARILVLTRENAGLRADLALAARTLDRQRKGATMTITDAKDRVIKIGAALREAHNVMMGERVPATVDLLSLDVKIMALHAAVAELARSVVRLLGEVGGVCPDHCTHPEHVGRAVRS